MALRALKRAEANNGTQCITTIEHPWGSWLWYFSLVDKLTDGSYRFAEGSGCCFGGRRVKWYALLGNSREIHREVHRPDCPGHENLISYDVRRRSDGSLQRRRSQSIRRPGVRPMLVGCVEKLNFVVGWSMQRL